MISENSMKCFVGYIQNWMKEHDFDLPYNEIRSIIERWSYFVEDEDSLYNTIDENHDNILLDTATRELLKEIIAKEFVGQDYTWPCNGDSPEYSNKFVNKLCRNILNREKEMKGIENATSS